YSVWATQAQLMAAYAHYLNNTYDEAINALDRFIELHPGHRDVAYAYYLRAISHYEQISDVGRDQRQTRLALEGLEEVVRRFPDSRYARDAAFKLDLARDHLAGKHMTVGRFYQEKGEYLAAINRFRLVIRDYQTTTHVPEALHRLVECYLALGVSDEAQATAAVLGYNYPGNPWYADSYTLLTGVDLLPEEQEGSWISRVWNSLL
ncbi:MAG TPA: outer membrane protein assembly factor BamD, partial [Kiloniellales bacterium]|nr:outer membrane protein assembly factor BamD [Kiloniellales bacterium]